MVETGWQLLDNVTDKGKVIHSRRTQVNPFLKIAILDNEMTEAILTVNFRTPVDLIHSSVFLYILRYANVLAAQHRSLPRGREVLLNIVVPHPCLRDMLRVSFGTTLSGWFPILTQLHPLSCKHKHDKAIDPGLLP
jgi:hypothetical protein